MEAGSFFLHGLKKYFAQQKSRGGHAPPPAFAGHVIGISMDLIFDRTSYFEIHHP